MLASPHCSTTLDENDLDLALLRQRCLVMYVLAGGKGRKLGTDND